MEKLIALIDSLVREEIQNNYQSIKGPRGFRGRDGNDFEFETNKKNIESIISSKIESIKDDLSIKFKDISKADRDSLTLKFKHLSEDEILSLKGNKGDKGPKGQAGESFSWEDNEKGISRIIENYFEEIKDGLKLKYSDLTIDEIGELRGAKGSPGKNGRDFSFDDNKDEIVEIIKSSIESIKSQLKLKFTDLSDEEMLQLKGPKGLKGPAGRSFDWGENEDSINHLINSYVDSISSKFKLKFDDLTEDEKHQIRGEKGSRGQKGSSFNWLANREEIFRELKFYFDKEKDTFKLKFKDLDQKDIDGLKLTFDQLSEDDRFKIRGEKGPRGQKGKPGLSGEDGMSAFEVWKSIGNDGDEKDFITALKLLGPRGLPGVTGSPGVDGKLGSSGQDGVDAPKIINVEIVQKKEKFFFIFHFDNSTFIETDYIKIPELKKVIRGAMAFPIIGSTTSCKSSKMIYAGDVIIAEEFFAVDEQIDANRVARIDYTYENEFVTIEELKYYASDGLTVKVTLTTTYTYDGDNVATISVDRA